MWSLALLVCAANSIILVASAERMPSKTARWGTRGRPFLLSIIRGGDSKNNQRSWMNQVWGNLANDKSAESQPYNEATIALGDSEQPPPPPSFPHDHPPEQNIADEATGNSRHHTQNNGPDPSQVQQQHEPPPPPFFYAPPIYSDNSMSSQNANAPPPLDNYYDRREESRTAVEDGYNTMFPYPNPFFYQQQQQQDMYLSDLQATISSLQYQLQRSEDSLNNVTSSCSHYQTLSLTLQQKVDECQDELRIVNTKATQHELHALELQEKCDALLQLQESSQQTFQELQDDYLKQQQTLENITDTYNLLQQTYKTSLEEITILATAMEKHRIRIIETMEQEKEERERLLNQRLEKQQLQQLKQENKSGTSFWAKVFSFFFGSNKKVNEEEQSAMLLDDDDEVDEDSYEEAQNLAQRSLLFALTQSREYVSELETLVEAFEQNCTSNQEQLQSKHELINELHNRIAVFEDDKFVLKAALQQLRKEMKAEESKSVELEGNLKQKDFEIETLEETIRQLKSNHSAQILSLEREMLQANKTLSDNLRTAEEIEVYVDRLEQRLVTLSRARDEALLEAEEAAANVTAIATEAEKRQERNHDLLMQTMQEEISTMQQEHADEIEIFKERLRAAEENVERTISEKDNLESQLQEAGKERAKLQGEVVQLQLQMIELQEKLEEVVGQLELERKERADIETSIFLAKERDETNMLRDQQVYTSITDAEQLNSNEHSSNNSSIINSSHDQSSDEESLEEEYMMESDFPEDLFSENENQTAVNAYTEQHTNPSLLSETSIISPLTANSDIPQHLNAIDDVLPDLLSFANSECVNTTGAKVLTGEGLEPDLEEKNHPNFDIPSSHGLHSSNVFYGTKSMMSKKGAVKKQKTLRNIRKTFSRVTGMHGFFSGSYLSIKAKNRSRPTNFTSLPKRAVHSDKFSVLDKPPL